MAGKRTTVGGLWFGRVEEGAARTHTVAHPALANSSATVRPMPPPAPVMIACFPLRTLAGAAAVQSWRDSVARRRVARSVFIVLIVLARKPIQSRRSSLDLLSLHSSSLCSLRNQRFSLAFERRWLGRMGTPTSFSSPADLVRVIFELASLFLCALGCVVVGRVAASWVFGSLIADLTWVVFGAFASQHLSHYISACAAAPLGQRYPVAEDSDYDDLADEQDYDENCDGGDGDSDGDGYSDGYGDSDETSGGTQTVLAESLNHTPTPGATQFTPVMYELDHPFESAVSVWWSLTNPGTFADYLEGKLKRVEVVRGDAATSHHSMGRSRMESKNGDDTSAHNCVRRRVLYFEGNPPWWVKRLMSSAGIEIVEESIRDAEGKVRRRGEE